MMAMAATMVFLGALALAIAAMWITVAPQWQRVIRLAAGNLDHATIGQLALAERRLAVRSRAMVPAQVPVRRLRAA